MPRIFAPDENYNAAQGEITFVNGAAAVAADATDAIAYYTAEGYDVDTSKHELTSLDTLPRATLDDISVYLGTALTPGDAKWDVVRDIETNVSGVKLGALTVASVAHGSTVGNTVVTIAEALTGTNVHKYKTHPTVAPAPLYGDEADSTWTAMTSAAAAGLTLTTGHLITVVECGVSDGFIYKAGNDTVASKA
jgi:hypothetical protein